jgi:histidine ammonia-lyase
LQALHINGNDLTLEAVREVARTDIRQPVLLAPDAREAVNRARAVVDALVAQNKISYAITTGVGKLSDVHIVGDQVRELQVNLVRSHAVGVGEPLSVSDTRAMMLLRANSLSKGNSGVRAITIDTICEMLNRGVTPMVPSQGSVGASGDLAPLAHLALALIGEGECFDEKGARMASAEALKRAQIKPLILEAKEAVSLINGTQAMLAIGALMLLAAETLVDTADVIGAMACDALKGTNVAFKSKPRRICVVCLNRARSENHTVIAAACRMPIRCAVYRRCMAQCATRWPTAVLFLRSRRTQPSITHWYL